jgi:hypothetical protein
MIVCHTETDVRFALLTGLVFVVKGAKWPTVNES